MRLNGRLVRGDRELARHSQAHQQKARRRAVLRCQFDGNRLALARHVDQLSAFDGGSEFLRGAGDDGGVANFDGRDAAPERAPSEPLGDGFNFRKFWHDSGLGTWDTGYGTWDSEFRSDL